MIDELCVMHALWQKWAVKWCILGINRLVLSMEIADLLNFTMLWQSCDMTFSGFDCVKNFNCGRLQIFVNGPSVYFRLDQ